MNNYIPLSKKLPSFWSVAKKLPSFWSVAKKLPSFWSVAKKLPSFWSVAKKLPSFWSVAKFFSYCPDVYVQLWAEWCNKRRWHVKELCLCIVLGSPYLLLLCWLMGS